jgi:hypothetical protein
LFESVTAEPALPLPLTAEQIERMKASAEANGTAEAIDSREKEPEEWHLD